MIHPAVIRIWQRTRRPGESRGCTEQVGAKWLADWCMRAAGDMDVAPVASTVAMAVLEGRSADALASDLFNVLGDGAFDAIQVVGRAPIIAPPLAHIEKTAVLRDTFDCGHRKTHFSEVLHCECHSKSTFTIYFCPSWHNDHQLSMRAEYA